MKRALCLLLCACALMTLCTCGAESGEAGAVTLWCAADDPLLPALRQAVEEYNRGLGNKALPVTLRTFADGEALANALNTAQPDLLICSHTLAFPLEDRGLLTESGVSVPYPEELAARSGRVGHSLFPLGSRVQLLLSREGLTDQDFAALCEKSAAYGEEKRLPYLAADSYADLLCQALLGSGEFHADRAKDCFHAPFREAWNAMAEAAFSGGLYVGEDPALAMFMSGVPNALVFSDALAGGIPEDCALSVPDTGGLPLFADLRCLAVLTREGRQQRGTAAFLTWLFSGERPAKLALSAGLIPALPGGAGGDALSDLLLTLRERPLWFPDGGSDYVKNRAAFERDFRAAMDLLK